MHFAQMDPRLYVRLFQVWPNDWEKVYFQLLQKLFPHVVDGSAYDVSNIPVDEVGLHIYRRKNHGLSPSICVVLRRTGPPADEWVLVVTSDWIQTHKKMTAPIWIRSSDLAGRVFRNDLFLEILHRT